MVTYVFLHTSGTVRVGRPSNLEEHPMDYENPQLLAIESACKNLVARAAYLTDKQDHEAFAECFTANARLTRPGGEPLIGREAILASYRGRPADRITRHLITNTFMT